MMKHKRRKKQKSKWIVSIGWWSLGLFTIGSITALTVSAFSWAQSTDHYTLKAVKLSGNDYLQKQEILKWIQLPQFSKLDDLDLLALQNNLEKHPFIKAARISRDFPSVLKIDVFERKPIAYIDHDPYYLIDAEGVIIPLKDGIFDFDIPTLTGFNPADELYPVGNRCLSKKILEAVNIISAIRGAYPKLYNDLSELMIDIGDEYILCLSKKPTRIYLGSQDISQQVKLLNFFERTIRGIRSIYDYQYVDLRYEKQIVAKERKKV